MFLQKSAWICTLLGSLSLVACSDSNNAGLSKPSQDGPTILIEREKRLDDEQAYIRLIREIVQECQSTKAAGGIADPQARAISDAEILQLEAVRTLEAFDGTRYSKVKTFSQIDHQKWGALQDQSCTPLAEHTKVVEIKGACDGVLIKYDLDHGGGTKNVDPMEPCESMAQLKSKNTLTGERMTIPGTSLSCRWNVPAGDLDLTVGRVCLLEPWFQYPGSERDLEIANQVKLPPHPSPFFQMVTQAVDASEHPLRVEVGKALPAGIFDVPDDAKGFPAP